MVKIPSLPTEGAPRYFAASAVVRIPDMLSHATSGSGAASLIPVSML